MVKAIKLPKNAYLSFQRARKKWSWLGEAQDVLYSPLVSGSGLLKTLSRDLEVFFRKHQDYRQKAHQWIDQKKFKELCKYYESWPQSVRRLPCLAQGQQQYYGRPDVVWSDRGIEFVEANFLTAVAGFEKPQEITALSRRILGLKGSAALGGPYRGLVEYFSDLCGPLGGEAQILWMARDRNFPIYTEMAKKLTALRPRIQHHVIAPSAKIPRLSKRKPVVLHRSLTIYSYQADQGWDSIFKKLEGRVDYQTQALENDIFGSKIFLPKLSQDAELKHCVPETHFVAEMGMNQLKDLINDRREFVIKMTDSHLGKQVYFGHQYAEMDWRVHVERCRNDQRNLWIAQRRVKPRMVKLYRYDGQSEMAIKTGLSTCSYYLGGRVRGLETWLIPELPDHSMLSQMEFAGHWIE